MVNTKCPVCHCLVKNCKCECPTCQHLDSDCRCCSDCKSYPCQCPEPCRNCQKPDCGICCTRCLLELTQCKCCGTCQSIQQDCSCPVPVPVPANTNPRAPPPRHQLATFTMSSTLEPPDMGILKDRSQLEFYISALERWATIATATGVDATLRADIVLAHAFKQAPDLCRELNDHFGQTLNTADSITKIADWLRSKFGMNKHADMVRILNTFLNTTRSKGENLVDFIARLRRTTRKSRRWENHFQKPASPFSS